MGCEDEDADVRQSMQNLILLHGAQQSSKSSTLESKLPALVNLYDSIRAATQFSASMV